MVDSYEFSHEVHGDLVEIDFHTDNPLHRPAIRWRVDSTGRTGAERAVRLPADMHGGQQHGYGDPVLAFVSIGSESVEVAGEERRLLVLPRPLAAEINMKEEQLGTAILDDDRICTDPGAFPEVIEEPDTAKFPITYTKERWSEGEHMMWYHDDDGFTVPYQIEDGELVQRPEEVSRNILDILKHYYGFL